MGGTVIYVLKTKYFFGKTFVIKAEYKLLIIANFFLYIITLFVNMFVCFWDRAIYVIKTKNEIMKLYVVKAKYNLLVKTSLRFLLYV